MEIENSNFHMLQWHDLLTAIRNDGTTALLLVWTLHNVEFVGFCDQNYRLRLFALCILSFNSYNENKLSL